MNNPRLDLSFNKIGEGEEGRSCEREPTSALPWPPLPHWHWSAAAAGDGGLWGGLGRRVEEPIPLPWETTWRGRGPIVHSGPLVSGTGLIRDVRD